MVEFTPPCIEFQSRVTAEAAMTLMRRISTLTASATLVTAQSLPSAFTRQAAPNQVTPYQDPHISKKFNFSTVNRRGGI